MTVKFLHELFSRFGLVDCIVTDNGTQFTSHEFKDFCQSFLIEHITTAPFHPRSNGQAERFVDTFKRALRKARGTPTDTAIHQFLQVYRVTPNSSAPSAKTPAEGMFARKVKSVFDKFIPKETKAGNRNKVFKKRFKIGEKGFFVYLRIIKLAGR